MSKTLTRTAVALAACGIAAATVAAPVQASETSHVSVLHGVPDATVDVWANGKPFITNFKPATLTEPKSLPAGTYDLKVVKAGAAADSEAIVEAKGVKVPGGKNITIVAHLGAEGGVKLTPFVNDTSKIAAGKTRLTVRHVAKAPAVDVRANEKVAFSNLVNPKEAKADLDAGTIKADVVLAGTDKVAIGPADLKLAEGQSTIVYAWGDASSKLNLATQTISKLHSHPGHVSSGTGGQAAADSSRVYATAAAAGAAGVLGFVMLRRNRTATQRSN